MNYYLKLGFFFVYDIHALNTLEMKKNLFGINFIKDTNQDLKSAKQKKLWLKFEISSVKLVYAI